MDGYRRLEDRWEAGGRVSLSGLAQRAESKWYRSTMADSMAPLITFNQSCIDGPSQHHYQTPPVSYLLSSFFPLHSNFLLCFFYLTTLSATHTVYQTYRQSHHAPQPVYYTLLLPNSLLLLYYCMMGPTTAQQNLDYLWPWLHNGRTISLSISG